MSEQKIPKATHEGVLKLGNAKIEVAVLDTGQRIITHRGVFEALDRPARGNSRVIGIPAFMDAKNLQPFVDEQLMRVITKVVYLDKRGKVQEGFDAFIIPLVSDLYLRAREAGVITSENQKDTAKKAEIIVRSLAKVAITALIDEVTGYQYLREKHELQTILQTFISDEILEWQRTFQLSFYKEIYRLWNIPFTVENIRRKPLFIGNLTKKFVYENLPKGTFVLQKLKENTPKTKGGNYRYRLHQSLTKEVGREALIKVINSVEALASISHTKEQFIKFMQDKYGQGSIPFPNVEEIDKASKIDEPIDEDNHKTEDNQLNEFDENLKNIMKVPHPDKEVKPIEPKPDQPNKKRGRPKKDKPKDLPPL